MAGYPGTVASTWQRSGRAGRRQNTSLAVLVASSAPLDQYIVEHPDYFFSQAPERAAIHPDNLEILVNHLKWAAFELPVKDGEKFGPHETGKLCRFLGELGLLHHSAGAWHWTSDTYPADAISLRAVTSDNFGAPLAVFESACRRMGHSDGEREHAVSQPGQRLRRAGRAVESPVNIGDYGRLGYPFSGCNFPRPDLGSIESGVDSIEDCVTLHLEHFTIALPGFHPIEYAFAGVVEQQGAWPVALGEPERPIHGESRCCWLLAALFFSWPGSARPCGIPFVHYSHQPRSGGAHSDGRISGQDNGMPLVLHQIENPELTSPVREVHRQQGSEGSVLCQEQDTILIPEIGTKRRRDAGVNDPARHAESERAAIVGEDFHGFLPRRRPAHQSRDGYVAIVRPWESTGFPRSQVHRHSPFLFESGPVLIQAGQMQRQGGSTGWEIEEPFCHEAILIRICECDRVPWADDMEHRELIHFGDTRAAHHDDPEVVVACNELYSGCGGHNLAQLAQFAIVAQRVKSDGVAKIRALVGGGTAWASTDEI